MSQPAVVGLDFGTTNTVLARRRGNAIEAVPFRHGGAVVETFRSVLALWQEAADVGLLTRLEAGPWAMDRFLEEPADTRFLQSFKTFAASRAFTATTIAGRRFAFEDLLEGFFRAFLRHAGEPLARLPDRLVLGRPVAFAGVSADPALARERYEAAFRAFGFTTIHHVYEPVAAAFYFAKRLTADATVLVADFGGGTSDFSVLRFVRSGDRFTAEPLGHAGVAVAGDSFDFRIIDALVSPRLGKGTTYASWGKTLDVPGHYYANFARWSQLSLMKAPKLLAELREIARTASAPERLRAFVDFIDADQGYPLYQALTEAKIRLSEHETTRLRFRGGGLSLDEPLNRRDFEHWIAPDLDRIDVAVTSVLARAGLTEGGVDRVFLTGGSSFVPAVRDRFARRFSADRLDDGAQMLSIAYGLALIGETDDPERWTVTAEAAPSPADEA
jgi:hypothetical chaperone protein